MKSKFLYKRSILQLLDIKLHEAIVFEKST